MSALAVCGLIGAAHVSTVTGEAGGDAGGGSAVTTGGSGEASGVGQLTCGSAHVRSYVYRGRHSGIASVQPSAEACETNENRPLSLSSKHRRSATPSPSQSAEFGR